MPPKTVASILNNESNLRILERLKARPYYPRELAAEMKLSEPFIVRRLKAMEEYGIVEGRWETEGSRKVKRYYVKDVTMQLGKGGLEVKAAEARASTGFNLEKEALRIIIAAPLVILGFVGVILGQPVIIAAACLLLAWQTVVDMALYRDHRYNTLLTEIILIIIGLGFFISNIIPLMLPNIPYLINGNVGWSYGIIFVVLLVFHVRFSLVEASDWALDKGKLMSGLNDAPLSVKLFYLPSVLRWKVGEYLGLLS